MDMGAMPWRNKRPAELRESRRLFYVDLTRARDAVHMLSGRPKIMLVEPGPKEQPVMEVAGDLERALEAARARGRVRAAEILSGDDMLSAEQFAELIGTSRATVNTKRQNNQVSETSGSRAASARLSSSFSGPCSNTAATALRS